MDLNYMTKALSEKEKTQTKSDSSYQKSKANLDNKEREIKSIEVKAKHCHFGQKGTFVECSFVPNRINYLASTMKMVYWSVSRVNVMH